MTASAKTHGMDGTLVEPDWAPLTLEELRALFVHFPALGEPERILSYSPRPFSAASVVKSRNGKVFVKRHHRAVRDREGLLEEHRFLTHLLLRGAAVPRVLESAAGQTAIEMGEWTYEAHEVPEGADLYRDAISWTPFRRRSRVHGRRGTGPAASGVARFCRASPRAASLGCELLDLRGREPRRGVGSYLAARPALAGHEAVRSCAVQALRLLAPFHAALEPLLAALPPLWTHNDLHASNLFWSDGERRWRGPRPSSTSVLPTAPTPSTTSPMPSSATSWSGSCW